MGFYRGPNIVTDGLVLAIDAGSTRSYSGFGTSWNNLYGTENLTINGSPTHTATNPGYFTLPNLQITQYFISNPFSHPTTDVTYESWVKFSSTNMTGALISYAVSGNDNHSLIFWDVGILNFYGPSGYFSTSWSIPNTTNWYHVVRTRISSTGSETLYINGGSIFSTTLSAGSTFESGGSLVIGQEQDSVGGGFSTAQCFYGNISSVKIYNKSLSSIEVQQNYNAHKSRFGY